MTNAIAYDYAGLLCVHCDQERDDHWSRDHYCTAKGAEFRTGMTYEPDIEPVVCNTKAEWDIAYAEWKANGARGGRWGRPRLAALTSCDACGGAKIDPELMPAFARGNFCWCAPSTGGTQDG